MSEFVKEIEKEQYEQEVLNSKKPVILDFYSTDCPPCESLAPKFEKLAEKFHSDIRFIKIFRQGNRDLAESLGVKSSPTLLFFQNGKEVAERLNGVIKKKDIYEKITQLIGMERAAELYGTPKKETHHFDIAILGGGPAGLSAAIYAAQAKMHTAVIDMGLAGGQVSTTHLVSNYPGTEKPLAGYELSHRMFRQAEKTGAYFFTGVDITDLKLERGNHQILLDDEIEIIAKSIVLATGARPRDLNIPGEKELRGKGISYCAVCDGSMYEGKDVLVIGGGNSALEESLYLTRYAKKITILHQFQEFQANQTAIEEVSNHPNIDFILASEAREFRLTKDNRIEITYENLKTGEENTIIRDGVFVFIGMVPNLPSADLPIAKNTDGYILTDENMRTNMETVYAAGDIRQKRFRQIATAVSDGCIAALSAEKEIEKFKKLYTSKAS